MPRKLAKQSIWNKHRIIVKISHKISHKFSHRDNNQFFSKRERLLFLRIALRSQISARLGNTSSVTKNKVKSFISVVYLYVRSWLKRRTAIEDRINSAAIATDAPTRPTGARHRRSSIARVGSCPLEYLYIYLYGYVCIYIKSMCHAHILHTRAHIYVRVQTWTTIA